jgi:hypothetical protein
MLGTSRISKLILSAGINGLPNDLIGSRDIAQRCCYAVGVELEQSMVGEVHAVITPTPDAGERPQLDSPKQQASPESPVLRLPN